MAKPDHPFHEGRGRGGVSPARRGERQFSQHRQSIYKGKKMRNASVFTIAPTGTISRIAGCSSSIEPVFAFKLTSKIMDTEITDLHPLSAAWKKKHPGEPLPAYFITAQEISPEDHLRTQEVFQKYVDSAVSKTINLPNAATLKDIARSLLQAFDMNIKGITVYRDGCRADQVLNKDGRRKPALAPGAAGRAALGHPQDHHRLRQTLYHHHLFQSEALRSVRLHREKRLFDHGRRRSDRPTDLAGSAQRRGAEGTRFPA